MNELVCTFENVESQKALNMFHFQDTFLLFSSFMPGMGIIFLAEELFIGVGEAHSKT